MSVREERHRDICNIAAPLQDCLRLKLVVTDSSQPVNQIRVKWWVIVFCVETKCPPTKSKRFAEGAESARKDILAEQGIDTCKTFHANQTTVLPHIQLVQELDENFGTVESIERDSEGKGVYFVNAKGDKSFAEVDWKFLE